MKLANFISKDLICAGVKSTDKVELLKYLSDQLASHTESVDGNELFENLLKREQENSTGIGNSIAIPHAIDETVKSTHCLVAQIKDGIEFDAMDGQKVKLIFILLSPPGLMSEHIRLLARITRIIKEQETVDKIWQAENKEEIYKLILEEDAKHV